MASGLYPGVVSHTRIKPRRHALRYRIFMLLLDLDELDALDRGLKLFSLGRFNLTGFDPRRHGDGSATPLKQQVEARLAAAGIAHGGPVRLLAMPRILGGGFNPLTVYWCHRPDGALSAILYEVNNTFGERHSYLIPAEDAPVVKQACDKGFYVSPSWTWISSTRSGSGRRPNRSRFWSTWTTPRAGCWPRGSWPRGRTSPTATCCARGSSIPG